MDNYNFTNSNGMQPTFGQYMQQPYMPDLAYRQSSPGPMLRTNRILVANVNEAIFRSNDRGSEMYYFDQNKPVFYVVRVDMEGRKSWVEVPYGAPAPDNNSPATRAEVAELRKKFEEFEAKFLTTSNTSKPKKNKTEVVEHDESAG